MGTLRSAIAWANVSTNANPENLAPNATAPNTVVFDKSSAFSTPQTITISPTLGPINLDNTSSTGESIDGTASSGLIISGGGLAQLFTVAPGSTATLTGVTLTGGYSATSGGAIVNMGSLAVNDSTLIGQFGRRRRRRDRQPGRAGHPVVDPERQLRRRIRRRDRRRVLGHARPSRTARSPSTGRPRAAASIPQAP